MPETEPGLNATFDLVSPPSSPDSSTNGSSSTVVVADDRPRSHPSILQGSHYVAQLALDGVRRSQGGNYSCRPSNAGTVSVRLHLIDGERRI